MTVSMGSAMPSRFTLTAPIPMDGTKQPPFIICKGHHGENKEKSLNEIFSGGIIARVQLRGWINYYAMKLQYK